MSVQTELTIPDGYRPMRLQDLEAVLVLERRAYAFPWSATNFSACLHAQYSAWVVQEASELVAYGIYSVAVGEATILNLCVSPTHQRRGLGQQLLLFLLAAAKTEQAQEVFLEVRQSNQAARALYESLGFNQYAERKNYYPGVGGRENALLYCKTLLDQTDPPR